MSEGTESIRIRRTPESDRSQVLILEKRTKISEGDGMATGGIYQAEGQIQGDWRRRRVPIVIKAYKHNAHDLFPGIASTHRAARHDKLRVPRTVRYNVEHGIVVLTDFNSQGHIALSYNNPSELVAENSLTTIPGFETVIKEVFAQAAFAASKNYAVLADCYFILIPSKEGETADFVIGDLENLIKRDGEDPAGLSLAYYNLDAAKRFLDGFCKKWLTENSLKMYENLIDEAWKDARNK
ncbi:hypothetical protein K2Y00_00465 [Patescibacteria group bacterium]|nr:hypothetical protein [Patescibacteria group bacterium]